MFESLIRFNSSQISREQNNRKSLKKQETEDLEVKQSKKGEEPMLAFPKLEKSPGSKRFQSPLEIKIHKPSHTFSENIDPYSFQNNNQSSGPAAFLKDRKQRGSMDSPLQLKNPRLNSHSNSPNILSIAHQGSFVMHTVDEEGEEEEMEVDSLKVGLS